MYLDLVIIHLITEILHVVSYHILYGIPERFSVAPSYFVVIHNIKYLIFQNIFVVRMNIGGKEVAQ